MIKTKEKLKKILSGIMIILMLTIALGDVKTDAVEETAEFSISYRQLTLLKGTSKKLKVANLPKANAKVKWSSSNKFAVKVTKKGKVKALNYGTATITAKCKKKKVTCVVTVPDDSRSVTLGTSNITINEQSTYQLVATSLNPVSYISSNEDIVVVDGNGLITGINPGVAIVTAKSAYGYAKCTVLVNSIDTEVVSDASITNKKVVAIRRLTKKNNIVYDDISWAKNKDITFKIDNLDESTVKKCVWSTDDNTILSNPEKSSSSKIQAMAQTLKEGQTKVKATVTDKSGNVKTYASDVYVTAPTLNTKNVILLGSDAGSGRQQFISISGLSKYSNIEWTNSNYESATFTTYNTKIAVWGLKAGTGTITASVDGKTYQITYATVDPNVKGIMSLLAKGKNTSLGITGVDGITPIYSVRNTKVATVDATGVVTGVNAGVTYIDVKLGKMNFSYRVEVAAKGMKKIIKRAKYIVENWTYSQGKRMKKGYYDCSALVWKGYKKYNNYQKKLGSKTYALPAGELFDYLESKGEIVYYGYTGVDNLQPGDLIFYGDYENAVRYSTPGRTLDIYHVSMYAGLGQVVEKGGQTINYNGTKYIVGIGRVVK